MFLFPHVVNLELDEIDNLIKEREARGPSVDPFYFETLMIFHEVLKHEKLLF